MPHPWIAGCQLLPPLGKCLLIHFAAFFVANVRSPELLIELPLLSLGQTLSTFHYTLLDKFRALLSVVERGRPNALDFSLDLELNIPRMYSLMNNSFRECFVHYLVNSNCACVRSTTLDNFVLDQTSLDKLQSSRLHSTRWPNALDISLNMHVERCIVKSRERLARALCKKPSQIFLDAYI